MCFSATASLGAGAVLGVIGVISVSKTTKPVQIPFAAIPLIFAAQQISEGFVWLSLTDSAYEAFKFPATYLYLFFAQVFWPFWVPFSAMKLEPAGRRKKLIGIMLAGGAIASLYFLVNLFVFPVEGMIQDCHVLYLFAFPETITVIVSAIYAIATIGALLVSTIKGIRLFGIAVFVAYIISGIFYLDYFVSVWCFFSAILSLIIVSVIYRMRQIKPQAKYYE